MNHRKELNSLCLF